MPKRLLHKIAKDYDIEASDLREIVFNNLDESMIAGKRGLVWINEEGQSALDDILPKRYLRSGIVKSNCPNKNFVYVIDRERMEKVTVRIPTKLRYKLAGKRIRFNETKNENGETGYEYVKC